MMNNPCIYIIKHPETYEIRYVGVTINFNQRIKEHLRNVNKKDRKHLPLYCRMRSLNIMPIIEILQEFAYNTERSLLSDAEIYWIGYFKQLGCPLLNCTDGGGLINPTLEIRKKISESKKKLYRDNLYANPSKGRPNGTRKPFIDMYNRKWDHTRQAAEYYGIDRASIMRVLKGKQKTVAGLKFSYIFQ